MKLTAFAIVPICLLVACGGGGSGSDPAPTTPSPPLTPPSLLRPESAWTAPLPAQATMISAEAFEAGLRDGSLTLVTPEQMADQQGAARLRREGTLRDDLGYLRGLADRGRKTDALLAKAAASADPFAEPVGDVGGAPVRLLSAAAAVGNVAEAQRKARDPAALRLAYSAQFALLSAVRPELATEALCVAGEEPGRARHLLGLRRHRCDREPRTRAGRQHAQPLGAVPGRPGQARLGRRGLRGRLSVGIRPRRSAGKPPAAATRELLDLQPLAGPSRCRRPRRLRLLLQRLQRLLLGDGASGLQSVSHLLLGLCDPDLHRQRHRRKPGDGDLGRRRG